jgi:hypothetical protein
VRPLTDDTIGDKLLRFVLGAVIGAFVTWFVALQWSSGEAGSLGRLVLGGAGLAGILAVLFGNMFLEGLLRGRWWGDWWD